MGKRARQIVFAGLAVVVVLVMVVGAILPSLVPPQSAGSLPPSAANQGATVPTPSADDQRRISTLEQAVAADPKDKAALIDLGNIYFDTDQFPKAAETYLKALELDPQNTDVRTDLGIAYFYQGIPSLAINEYRKVLEIDPNKVQAHFNLAIALSHSSPPDTEGAIAEWQAVVKLDPDGAIGKKAQEYIDSYQRNK